MMDTAVSRVLMGWWREAHLLINVCMMWTGEGDACEAFSKQKTGRPRL
jgi:hypothetical protein